MMKQGIRLVVSVLPQDLKFSEYLLYLFQFSAAPLPSLLCSLSLARGVREGAIAEDAWNKAVQ